MSPQEVGDCCGTQATHEGELEVLRAEIADLQRSVEQAWAFYQDTAHLMFEADDERRSIERLYARAIDAQVTLEKTLDHVRAESARQTEEIRALRQTVGAFYK